MSSTSVGLATRPREAPLRPWRLIAGLSGAAAGAAIVAGAFLPWVQAFAGLIKISGFRGSNGRILAAAGVLIAAAGLYHACRGGARSRWLTGLAGFAALGFSGYLLIQLSATMRSLGGNSMVVASGGPGLWVIAGGSLLAFSTLFMPASSAAAPAAARPAVARPPGGAARIRRSVLGWAADLESTGARRKLQIALGLIWLVDAALQFQPYMFGRAFVTQQLEPAAMGNPAVIASPAMWASRLMLHDVAAWNAAFALIQLAIAVGLLWRPAVRVALAGSIVWALAVWWLGEGLGGVLTGTATPVTGAPGAVILYALIAFLAWPRRFGAQERAGSQGRASAAIALGAFSWPRRSGAQEGASAPTALGGPRWASGAWLVLWGSFAYLILQAPVRAPRALHDAIAGNAASEPGWIASLDRGVAAAIGSHGMAASIALAAVFVLIAAGVFFPATIRPALVLAIIVSLAFWVVGENFGEVLTGVATDVNTGPLLILLAAAYWPLRPKASPAAAGIRGEYDAAYAVN